MHGSRDHSYRQNVTLLLLGIILRKTYIYVVLFGDIPIITTKNQTKSYILIYKKLTSCPQVPQLRFRTRDLQVGVPRLHFSER